MRRFIARFKFAWAYAYDTAKWQAFFKANTKGKTVVVKERSEADQIKHFDKTHFAAVTIGDRKFVYCPVGNICSWNDGDYDHRYCPWCKKYFTDIGA